MIQEKKLRKSTFKHIEAQWYDYKWSQQRIIRLREEILYPHNPYPENTAPGYNSARWPGDPVGNGAIRLSAHDNLIYLETYTHAIKKVYESSPEEYQKLARLRYWSRKPMEWVKIADELHVSRRQALRWRNELIYATAGIIGAV